MYVLAMFVIGALSGGTVTYADDWPEFRGRGRLGLWTETGILDTFPEDGLKVHWRVPVGEGYAGPAVADGLVFVADFIRTRGLQGTERALALDEKTGTVVWSQEWEADYRGIGYAYGPRATPTVDADRVYVQGAAGKLLCLDVKTGEILWQKDYLEEYTIEAQHWTYFWGFSSSPLVDGDLVICFVGGQPDAKIVAFDKMTGQEVWRALSGETDLGVGQPIIISAGGARQLIIWYPGALVSLDSATGAMFWEQPFEVYASMTVATPVQSGSLLFVSSFYEGSLMMRLNEDRPAATLLWKGNGASEIQTETLHAVTATPVIIGDHIYGICSYGQFRCLVKDTGERLWESQAVTAERARHAAGHIVRHGDRLFINNDRGELVIVEASPNGYVELDRTPLIAPTTNPVGRRELKNVTWSHPAYANRHIYARNDEEIISASLAADGT